MIELSIPSLGKNVCINTGLFIDGRMEEASNGKNIRNNKSCKQNKKLKQPGQDILFYGGTKFVQAITQVH
jgi:hypothetical protein